MDLFSLPSHQLHALLKKKEISPTDIVSSVFGRIDKVENNVKAFLFLNRDQALRRAKEIEEQGITSLLSGVPIAIKDNLCTKDVPTTCASKILKGYLPPYNATVIEKLNSLGAITIGKTNMDEFAMGSSCENSGYHPTSNPFDMSRVPGGSSGGSAASVAADESILALGSDTGGSIRQPAAFCGVVGLKPTYGRVSRYGLVAFASSLDQIGPITKDVTDCAILLEAISGFDKKDSTSVNIPVDQFVKELSDNIKGRKIGVIKELLGEGIEDEIKLAIVKAIDVFKYLGAEIEEVSFKSLKYALSAYYLIAPAEASSNLARYDAVKYGLRKEEKDLISTYYNTRGEGFGDEVKRRIILGTYALSAGYYDAYYLKAQKIRSIIYQEFSDLLKKFDVLISPTTPTVAFKQKERLEDPLSMYLSDIATIPINLAGLPAISIPCGEKKGLPIGLQIIGKSFDEKTILNIAYAYEQNTEWHRRKPNL